MIGGREIEVRLEQSSFQLGAPGPIARADQAGALFSSHQSALASNLALPSLGTILSQMRRFDDAVQAAVERPGAGDPVDAIVRKRVGHPVRLKSYLEGLGIGKGASGSLRESLRSGLENGSVQLGPDSDSSYESCLAWALQTLFTGEDSLHPRTLNLTEEYKLRLDDLTANLLLEFEPGREPQAPPDYAPPQKLLSRLEIGPRMRLEPAPSFYLRRAIGYRKQVTSLTAAGVDLKQLRITHESSASESISLDMALEEQIALFAGFYLVCASDLGVAPDESLDQACQKINWGHHFQKALNWIADPSRDPCVAGDPRTVMPFPNGEHFWCAAMLGIEVVPLVVTFRRPPVLESKTPGQPLPTARHIKTSYAGTREIWFAFDSASPPTPEAWRTLCSEHRTHAGILAALGDQE